MFQWLRREKKEHPDKVEAFEYNGTLYPNIYAMNCQKERDSKYEAKKELKNVLYYLALNKYTYEMLDGFEKQVAQCSVERHYIFRGEHNLDKLCDLLVEHWPYIQSAMATHHQKKREREISEQHKTGDQK